MSDSEKPKLGVVITLHPSREADDIVIGLRNLATEIEAGRFGQLTTVAVCMGHTYEEAGDGETHTVGERYTTAGLGPRHDAFTVRGLLLTCAGDLNGTIE